MLPYKLITGAEVIEFTDQIFKCSLDQSSVRLGQWTLITRVIFN